jgi:hypothetical protein
MLLVPEGGDFMALILLYVCRTREFKQRSSWLEPTVCGHTYVMTHTMDTVFSLIRSVVNENILLVVPDAICLTA